MHTEPTRPSTVTNREMSSIPPSFKTMVATSGFCAGSVDLRVRRGNIRRTSTALEPHEPSTSHTPSRKRTRHVTFAEDAQNEPITIDTSDGILGSVDRAARRSPCAVVRRKPLRPSLSAPGRIQRTASARRAECSRRKAAGVFGVEKLPPDSLDGPALLLAGCARGKCRVFVEERTVEREGATKLRTRPACRADDRCVAVSCQSQAQPGAYLPQIYRTQTAPIPRAGSSRKRRAHTLQGCGHVVHTKSPSSCAGNCACGVRSGRGYGDSMTREFEHPCIHCVKERLQQERLRDEHLKIDEHRSRVAEDVLSGVKELEKGREECAGFEKNVGRLWLAEINVGGQTALVERLAGSGVSGALHGEYEMGDMNWLRIPSVSQTNRLSDYRGQERSMDLLNTAVGLRLIN